MRPQSWASTTSCGVSHEPPQTRTLPSARNCGAVWGVMPPVGQKTMSGNGVFDAVDDDDRGHWAARGQFEGVHRHGVAVVSRLTLQSEVFQARGLCRTRQALVEARDACPRARKAQLMPKPLPRHSLFQRTAYVALVGHAGLVRRSLHRGEQFAWQAHVDPRLLGRELKACRPQPSQVECGEIRLGNKVRRRLVTLQAWSVALHSA